MGFWDFQHIYNEGHPENCAWCGTDLNESLLHPQNSVGDHWLPQSKGGVHATLPCCRSCNSTRRHMSPMRFLRYCRDNRPEKWTLMIEWHFARKNELSQKVQKVRDE